jgi:hypothetical protein
MSLPKIGGTAEVGWRSKLPPTRSLFSLAPISRRTFSSETFSIVASSDP